MLAALPDFVEEKRSGLVGGAMETVQQAAFFPASGRDQGTEFRLKQQLLALLRAQESDQGQCTLREFFHFGRTGTPAMGAPDRSFRFSFGHDGGDCTPTKGERNWQFAA